MFFLQLIACRGFRRTHLSLSQLLPQPLRLPQVTVTRLGVQWGYDPSFVSLSSRGHQRASPLLSWAWLTFEPQKLSP